MQASNEALERAAVREALDAIQPDPDVPPLRRECAGCDRPIPMKRLRALPGAKLCIGCQREVEGGRPF